MAVTTATLSTLPLEVLYYGVFDFLSFRDMCMIPFVNREFRSIAPDEVVFRHFVRKRCVPDTCFVKSWAKTGLIWERFNEGRVTFDPHPRGDRDILFHSSGHTLRQRSTGELVWETGLPLPLVDLRTAQIFQKRIWGITHDNQVCEVERENIRYSEDGGSISSIKLYPWVNPVEATHVFGNGHWIVTYTSHDSTWAFWNRESEGPYHEFSGALMPFHLDLGKKRCLFNYGIYSRGPRYLTWFLEGKAPTFQKYEMNRFYRTLDPLKSMFLSLTNQKNQKNTSLSFGDTIMAQRVIATLQTDAESMVVSGMFLTDKLFISYICATATDRIVCWDLGGKETGRCELGTRLKQPIRLEWRAPSHFVIFSQGEVAMVCDLCKKLSSPDIDTLVLTQSHGSSLDISSSSFTLSFDMFSESLEE